MIVLILYLALQIFISFYHEAWRDESQAWILARNTSVPEMFGLLSSEGHPCLWFIILKVCNLLGVSFYHFSFISITIMGIAAAVFLWKAPFHRLSKICILMSPIFFYYNSIICRVYALVVLLCVILCSIWPVRRENPIKYGVVVALLFQTHVMMAGLAMGCLLDEVLLNKRRFEKKHMAGAGISTLSFIFLALELWQDKETETFINVSDRIKSLLSEGAISNDFAIKMSSVFDVFNYKELPVGLLIRIIAISLCIFLIARLMSDSDYRLNALPGGIVSLCGILFYFGVILTIRKADHIQLAIVFWIILLFFVWTGSNSEDMLDWDSRQTGRNKLIEHIPELLLVFACIIVAPQSAYHAPKIDIVNQYSGSLEMAEMIEENLPDEEETVIAVQNDKLSTSIVAYLYESDKDVLIWDVDNGCEYRIHKWGKENKRNIVSGEQLALYLSSDIGRNEDVFFVKSSDSLIADDEGLIMLEKNSEKNMWNEYYYLYRTDN